MDLRELVTEIANSPDYKDLTDEQWIAKSALRGLTHRSQVDFDWWEDFYPEKITKLREKLAADWTFDIKISDDGKALNSAVERLDAMNAKMDEWYYCQAKEQRLLDKLAAVIEEQRLRKENVVVRTALHDATPIYIDYDSGSDANDGETTGNSVKTINKFTTTQARVAGDIGYLRANITWDQGTEATDIVFDEDGDKDNYISLIGCDSVTNDPWSDSSDVKPIIDFEDAAYQMSLTADHYWKISRLDFRQSADTLGAMIVNGSHNCYILSCNFQDMAAATTEGMYVLSTQFLKVEDCDFLDCYGSSIKITSSRAYIKNCRMVAGVDVKTDRGLYFDTLATIQIQDCVFSGAFDVSDMLVDGISSVCARNITWSASGNVVSENSILYSEDDDGTFESHISTFINGTITRDTGTVRGGGADSSALMSPNTQCGLYRPLLLGERLSGFRPIWVTAGSYTATVYIYDNTNWATQPGNSGGEKTCYLVTSELDNAGTAARVERTSAQDTVSASWVAFTTSISPARDGFVYFWVYLGAYESGKTLHVDILPTVV